MAEKPITFSEHCQLTSLGVSQESISFANVTLQSEAFCCVRENSQLAIVNLSDASVMRRPITAESALMNPTQRIIALRSGRNLQIFSLEAKAKVASHVMHEDVVYWQWISNQTVGVVTESAVYHWAMDGGQPPAKVFDRHASLAGHQIISYRASADEKWLVLVGISGNSAPGGFRVKGSMQLYSRDRGVSQPIEGHAAAFAELKTDSAPSPFKLFTFAVRTGTGAKLHVVEIDHQAGNPTFTKKAVDVFFPPEATNDFPVALQVSQRYGIAYLVTKYGFIHLYDLESGTCIYMNRISGETIFVTAEMESTSGVIGINRKGQVLSVAVDENTIIPYILSQLNNTELAFKLASRGNLPGADDLYRQQFHSLFSTGQYGEAAKIAANSPRGILRTPQTIEQFKQVPAQPGTLSPILQYFGILLEKGTLNKFESLELAKPVLVQNRKHLLEKWLKENKIECSEELGDIVRGHDLNLALSVYLRANVPHKVVACFAETGQLNKIVLYAKKVDYKPDYASLLAHIVRTNPEAGAEFASSLVQDEAGPLVDVERVTDIFMVNNMVQQATSFLLDALKDNKPEQAHLQTRLLEMNLTHAPQVADAILGNAMFTHYDRPRIANLCEKAGLLQRALEHFEDDADIRRVVVHTNLLNAEWLVDFFGRLTVEQSLDCMRDMLKANMRQNLSVVVQIATKYSDLLGPVKLIDMFESFKSFEGLYYYLGSVVNLSTDPEVHFKYIQAATRTGQIREVERVCRESNYYNAEKVKNFLKEAKLADQLPLIIVCDRFDFVHDLVLYLYQNMLVNFIEVYVQRVNSTRTPQVIGGLLDVDCDEGVIKNLLGSVTGPIPVDELVDEVEKRNRLKLILPWINSQIEKGSEDQALYNALGKISIDSNNNPEAFLKDNNLYDPRVVGKYCEKRDPYLAYIAYAKGFCDDELIAITNDNTMFKHQARYLVMRRQLDLWAQVLQPDNVHRRSLVDQVVSTAVPESTNPDDVSATVKAFMAADLPHELISLLEKIILEPSAFSDNKSLQNLLMLTAVRTDKSKVLGYIERLDGYDVQEIAKIAIDHGLYEEAFQIFNKAKQHLDAINVLVEHIVSIERGQQYAQKINQPALWARLGKAQLDGLRVNDAIASYIKAEDPSNYAEVIEIALRSGREEALISYLTMARGRAREPAIDTALVRCYAKADRLSDLQDFLTLTHTADLLKAGEEAFEDQCYEAARIIFTKLENHARLATTLVYLSDFTGALEAARKAGNTSVYKQIHAACLSAPKRELNLAKTAALAIVPHAEELPSLIKAYEREGLFDALVDVLEAALGLERAHMGIFTQCGVALAKYKPERFMEHLKLYWSRSNLPQLIRAAGDCHLWAEQVFLYCRYDEWDNASLATMEHAVAWEHQSFREMLAKVSNTEVIYRAISFYLEQHPLLLNDLLIGAIAARLDPGRVVRFIRKSDNLPLIEGYLRSLAEKDGEALDNETVNDAWHDLAVENEDYATLRVSIQAHDQYDKLALADRLKSHGLLEFRRLASVILAKEGRAADAIAVCKEDKLASDCIRIAAHSGDAAVIKELFEYYTVLGDWPAVAAITYAAYNDLSEDFVDEMAWRRGVPRDFVMPYKLQKTKHREDLMTSLATRLQSLEAKTTSKEKEEEEAPILGPGGPRLLTAAPTGFVNGGGMAGMPGMNPQMTGYMGGGLY